MKNDTRQIQELRGLTGVGVMDCKRALEESLGDFARTRALLAEKAEKTAQKKAIKEVKAWIVEQRFIKNQDVTVGSLVEGFIARSGENVQLLLLPRR